jgi:UDP-GlcNAc:undecaprenyl-phosphate GlcNAc-1-phosphate transferase
MALLYIAGFAVALLISLLSTPWVKRFALKIGAVDAPNHRKVHTRIMPRLGGLAIFAAFAVACVLFFPRVPGFNAHAALGLLAGGAVIVLVGALDDRFDLKPRLKLIGQIVAASIVVAFGLKVDLVNLPFGHSWSLMGWLSVLITIVWIVGVTNAINLIDGLDGLSAGVSAIATAAMLVLALLMGNVTVVLLCAILLGSIGGFLFYNFHPAQIFMGDSGALFLGFSLATLSILGFKQATVVSFLVPVLILGVPLSDTFFAIVRRWVNKRPISMPDKSHLHHCLLQLGFGHRTTVLIIYGIAAFFGICAVVLSQATTWGIVVLIAFILLVMEVGAEAIGIIGKSWKPVLHLLRKAKGLRVAKSRMPK